MTLSVKGSPDINYTFTGEVPKELMDAYEQVVGNGLSRVSVSADMGIKDFGTGASAMVTITLTCNQDQNTIDRAVTLAAELARGYAMENRQRAENELAPILEQKRQEAAARGQRY
jgi:hypothetical protein